VGEDSPPPYASSASAENPAVILPPPPSSSIPPVPETAAELFPETEADDVLVDENGKLRAASPSRLIERLAQPDRFDHRYSTMLLLTYRSFFTPLELLQALVSRYSMAPPGDVSEDEERHRLWVRLVQQPVQLMVCNVLQKWVSQYVYDDDLQPELLDAIDAFVETALATNYKVGSLLKAAVLKRRQNTRRARGELTFSEPPPQCLFTENFFSPIDRPASVAPLEWARQLTRIEFDLFCRISPKELFGQAWTKKDKEVRAPHVIALIQHFNNVSAWVASVVLSEAEMGQRAEAFSHLVEVATECGKLGNFNALFEIAAGLDLSAVHRLKATKAQLTPDITALHERLTEIVSTDGNRKVYRKALEDSRTGPTIPYMGIYLTDLTFIEDGHPNRIEKCVDRDGAEEKLSLVNWIKHQQYAAVVEDIRYYQQTHYNLAPCEPLDEYLRSAMLALLMDEKEQYERSLEVEPRGAAGAKVKEKKVDPLLKLMKGEI